MGKVRPGQVLNPKGHNGQNQGFAPWKIRINQLHAKYPTFEALMALFETDPDTGKRIPTKEFKQMNPIDTGLIWQLIGQNMGDDKRAERESFWDRYEGKPTQRHEVRVIRSFSDLTEDELAALAAEAENG